MPANLKNNELLCLVLMLFPFVSIIGFILYFVWTKPQGMKLIVAILTIFFGFFAAIFLWLDAFGVISLDK